MHIVMSAPKSFRKSKHYGVKEKLEGLTKEEMFQNEKTVQTLFSLLECGSNLQVSELYVEHVYYITIVWFKIYQTGKNNIGQDKIGIAHKSFSWNISTHFKRTTYTVL